MTKGFVMLAQNTDEVDYVKQAYLNALSIITYNPSSKVSLITNSSVEEKYKKIFDKIIEIPWTDDATATEWKIENRWKIYHASPYDETIVMDTDMLVLQDITHWWNILSKYDLYFVKNVKTYRNEIVEEMYYRKTFLANELPNIYVGFHYFKKSDLALEFYTLLEIIVNNWQRFYGEYVKLKQPKFLSIDVAAAIAVKILGIESQVTNKKLSIPNFTHMKSKIQNWKNTSDSWLSRIDLYIDDNLNIKIGNHLQDGILHYTEDDFCNEKLIKIYEEKLEI